MNISIERERDFEKKNIEKQKSKYLSTNSLNRYNNDEGYRDYEGKGYILDVGANTAGESDVISMQNINPF